MPQADEETGEVPRVPHSPSWQRDTKPLDVRAARRSARRGRRWIIPVAALVVVLGAGYAGACWYFADRVPKGATVAGVGIGGL
ncbi:MAG: YdgA family protein [Bifidobacteriaceae bacterium]|nr:YdgA family protein [Bifidobacteriaceae bacterium]